MGSKFYMLVTFVLILIIAGLFVVKPLMNSEEISSGTMVAEDLGEYQKVVLSLKDYNYYPQQIEISKDKPVRVYLDKSVQGCYRAFTIPSLNVEKFLPTESEFVEFKPESAGEYAFSCGMGMGRGKFIVK